MILLYKSSFFVLAPTGLAPVGAAGAPSPFHIGIPECALYLWDEGFALDQAFPDK